VRKSKAAASAPASQAEALSPPAERLCAGAWGVRSRHKPEALHTNRQPPAASGQCAGAAASLQVALLFCTWAGVSGPCIPPPGAVGMGLTRLPPPVLQWRAWRHNVLDVPPKAVCVRHKHTAGDSRQPASGLRQCPAECYARRSQLTVDMLLVGGQASSGPLGPLQAGPTPGGPNS
jgi:hypothetical protein